MRQVQQARGQRAQWSRARVVNCVARVKLTYFNPPGRVETSRIMLSLAQIDFDDNRISREQWAEVKPTTPYGQLPVLEWHGKVLAQSNAIDRFLAKMTGHYPIESFEQARVDSIVSFTEEFFQLFAPLFAIEDPEAKAKAIKAVVEGPLAARLERLEKMVEVVGDRGWLVGKHMTWADLAVYTILCNLTSGFLPGVPSDLYVTKYPILEAYRNRLASIPAIKAYFNKPENSDALRLSFRPSEVLVAA